MYNILFEYSTRSLSEEYIGSNNINKMTIPDDRGSNLFYHLHFYVARYALDKNSYILYKEENYICNIYQLQTIFKHIPNIDLYKSLKNI